MVIRTTFFLFWAISFPVINPWFYNFLAASRIFSIFPSFMPLILTSSFLVAITMEETVHSPAALSLAISAALIPQSWSFSISIKLADSSSYWAPSSSWSSFFLSLDLSFCFSFCFIQILWKWERKHSIIVYGIIIVKISWNLFLTTLSHD